MKVSLYIKVMLNKMFYMFMFVSYSLDIIRIFSSYFKILVGILYNFKDLYFNYKTFLSFPNHTFHSVVFYYDDS